MIRMAIRQEQGGLQRERLQAEGARLGLNAAAVAR